MPEINNSEKKEEDADKRKKSNLIKNKTTSIDSEAKWKLKSKCNWKRENRKETTFKKCWWKMRPISRDRKMRKKDKDSKILRLRMNTPECSINKKMIEEMK